MATDTKVFTLTGDALIAFVNDKMPLVNRGELTRTDMIKDAGYIYDNGTAAYVDFYTELLRAKGITPVTNTDTDAAAYDDLSGTEQDMYDAIHEKFGSKWDHEEIMEFMNELDDLGITTPESLDDAYEYQTDSYKPEEEFAEYIVMDVLYAPLPSIVEGCIDWYNVWNSSLRYDYNTIEFDGETFFFRNN